MGGVIAGGLVVLCTVVVTVFAVVLPLLRWQSDATARAQVTALKGAALGLGKDVPEVTSVYELDEPRRVAPARRVDRSVLELGATDARRDGIEAPHPGVLMPRKGWQAEPEPRPFGGW